MSGAYTAKFGSTYSLVMTMASRFLAGDSIDVIGSFRIDGNRTIEPPDPTTTWTATLDGNPVNLRIAGVGSYVSSLESEAADSGSYWQSSISLEFEGIGASAADQALIVSASATMVETNISDSKTATIPDYSLVVTGPSSAILFNAAASCEASYRADSTDKTAEPSNKTITWTSTIDGSPVDLKIDGDFAASVEDTVSDSGDFWEVTSSLTFDLTEGFTPRTLVVTGAGVIDGLEVNDTASFTIKGWREIIYSFLTEFTYLYDWSYEWRIYLEVWVYTLPSTEDWYKKIKYEVDGDQVYSEVVQVERGSEPDGITITPTHDGDYTGDTPWDATHLLEVFVDRQQANKKYRIKTAVQVRMSPARWVGTYLEEVFRDPGDLIADETGTSIPHFMPGSVDIETTDTTIVVTTTGAMW